MKFPKPWHRKGRGWYVTLEGRQIPLGDDKTEAFAKYREMLADPSEHLQAPQALIPIMESFLDWVEVHRAPDTYEWYRFRLARLADRYPNLTVNKLRPFHVQQWLDDMDLSSGSKRNYCRSIKRCLRWAKQQGYITVNPIAEMPEPRCGKRELTLSEDEFKELLSFIPEGEFRDLVVISWETGCRPQESLRVEGRHVDLRNQRWVFPKSESKTDLPRIVYLTDEALRITKKLLLEHPSGKLFRNTNGKPWSTDAVNCRFSYLQIQMGKRKLKSISETNDRRRKNLAVDDQSVESLMRQLSPTKRNGRKKTKAELRLEARRKLTFEKAKEVASKYSLYTLRHSWMNRLLKNGVDALTVAFLAGHTDPSTLAKVYAHLSQDPAYMLEQAKRSVNEPTSQRR